MKGGRGAVREARERILVVDDDHGILDSFDAIFGEEYPLVLMDRGRDAQKKLSEENFGLLFLDIKMPDLNGLELLRWIQARNLETKVVIITALPQASYEEIAHQCGAFRYVKKPFDVDELEDIARIVLH
jgi:DNA-binding NtrC family response regulator